MFKLFAFLLPILAFAQSDSASLVALIQDASGSSIPNASAKLRSMQFNTEFASQSSAEGRVLWDRLRPGTYILAVEATGFKRWESRAIEVSVAQTAAITVRMELGNAAEAITVNAEVSPLISETAAQGTVISERSVKGLALNGRQFLQLALLVPGAQIGGRNVQQNRLREGFTGGLSVNGNRTNNTAFLLDGAANTDPDYHSLNYAPIVDAVTEFQVQTALFSAEYGRASGGHVNVVTKSGSNDTHGSGWYFVRNSYFDARPFNLNASKLPQFQRNQFGGMIGGPIVKNRLFYFTAYERLTLNQASANLTTVAVPTANQRAGNFTGVTGGIFDPDSLNNGLRTRFPGDVIPASRINRLAQQVLSALPLPTIGATQFVNSAEVLTQRFNNVSARIDAIIGTSGQLFGRYSVSDEISSIPFTIPDRRNPNESRPHNLAIGYTQSFGPRIVNETRLGYQRIRFVNGIPEPTFSIDGQSRQLPNFIVAGVPSFGGAGPVNATGLGGLGLARSNTYQLYNNTSYQRGAWSFKFGGEIYNVQYNREEAPGVLGQFQYGTEITAATALNAAGQLTIVPGTGQSIASYLLSIPNQAARNLGPNAIDGRQTIYSLYTQADWKIRRNVTLNLGLRYEIGEPMWDRLGRTASIDFRGVPNVWQIFGEGRTNFYTPKLFVCGQDDTPRGCAYTDKNNWSPRVGLAWQVDPKTVIRTGGGIYYGVQDGNSIHRLSTALPFNVAQTQPNTLTAPTFRGFDVFGPAEIGRVRVQQTALDLFQRTPYSMQMSFNVQRQLLSNLVLEAGYVGTLGIKLEQNVQINNSRPGLTAVDPRRPYAALIYSPSVKFPPAYSVIGDRAPVGFINFFPHSAQSNYHALLVRLERRFSRGFGFLNSFTYSKSITNAPQFRNAGGFDGNENSPPQDSHILSTERGLASFHTTFRWVSSGLAELPFGKGKRFLTSGIASHIFGGFQISGIFSAQSGFPFTVNWQGDTAGIGGGTGAVIIRPNVVSRNGEPANPNLSASQQTTGRFFDTTALSAAPAGTLGNLGRNSIIGPSIVNLDTALMRNFRITERVGLQFRWESFNAANRPNWNIVGRIINNPTFGQVVNQLSPRQQQFALKLVF
jgi:hypothetical protein